MLSLRKNQVITTVIETLEYKQNAVCVIHKDNDSGNRL